MASHGTEEVLGLFTWSDDPAENHREIDMNLWLFRGEPPEDAREVEVVVKRFEFVIP